jgi:uncharacterized membrane protein
METSHSGPNVKRLIMVPALIALAITIFRLVGELAGGSSTLFNRAAGGGGALIGIVWLVPIFGVYFAVKLVGQGFGPGQCRQSHRIGGWGAGHRRGDACPGL